MRRFTRRLSLRKKWSQWSQEWFRAVFYWVCPGTTRLSGPVPVRSQWSQECSRLAGWDHSLDRGGTTLWTGG